jgi:hypothetical protein
MRVCVRVARHGPSAALTVTVTVVIVIVERSRNIKAVNDAWTRSSMTVGDRVIDGHVDFTGPRGRPPSLSVIKLAAAFCGRTHE